MPKKNKKNPTCYDSKYNREEFGTMKRYGDGDLYNEVELLRLSILRALDQMEKEKSKLTFHDHLSALHAFSRASGRIAYLMEMQEKIFPSIEKVNNLIREMNAKVDEILDSKIESYEAQGLELPREIQQLQHERFQRLLKDGI